MSPRYDRRLTTTPAVGTPAAKAIAEGAPVERLASAISSGVPVGEFEDLKSNPVATDFETLQARAKAAAYDSREALTIIKTMVEAQAAREKALADRGQWWRSTTGQIVTAATSSTVLAIVLPAIIKACG
jgi:hypothetical protein